MQYPIRMPVQCIAAGLLLWLAVSESGWAQSVGRGAPDPLVPDDIVGSEGKGYWTGAGVPPGYPPIFAARDGDIPAGVEPLPIDIFATTDFYQDEEYWGLVNVVVDVAPLAAEAGLDNNADQVEQQLL